jgi:hypothetical protein
MRISSGAVLIVFLHLIEHSLSLDSKSPAVADFGLNLGSVAAAKIAQNAARLSLERPKSLQLHVKTDESPWFDPIAFVDSRTGIALGWL